MYLRQRPTYYVKGSERCAAYYTVQARDLEAQGWIQEEDAKPAPKNEPKKQEVSVEPVKTKSTKSAKEKVTEPVSDTVKSEAEISANG